MHTFEIYLLGTRKESQELRKRTHTVISSEGRNCWRERYKNMAEARFWLAVLSVYHLYTMIGWCLAVQYCPNMCAVTRHHLLKNPSVFLPWALIGGANQPNESLNLLNLLSKTDMGQFTFKILFWYLALYLSSFFNFFFLN